ncbi:hypothetical protein AB0H88_37860 [Nonomuraea sp. NPDC050680]|uniref:hypothetical protein n=1 Tax=Nonomuraea sp. NPDC050680 TaxID=3154630 RepID=UPI0033E66AF7
MNSRRTDGQRRDLADPTLALGDLLLGCRDPFLGNGLAGSVSHIGALSCLSW